jgi:hypothetical protein
MLLPVQDKNSKMERNKKAIVGLILTSLLVFSVAPYFNVRAQTCDPDALVPVSYGQRGNAVRNAQACLIEAGYDIPAGATGYYGSQTRNAVREFYADWYGPWSGNSLGPKGVAELKSRLVAEAPKPQPQPQPQPTTGVSQEQLQQVLTLLSQGKTNEALALLLALLGGQQPTETPTPTPTPQPQPSQEGTLTVERNSNPPDGVPLREGETQAVLGIRFRATQGDVTVQRIRINWPTTAEAPHRVLSRVELVDESGNSLWSANVTPSEAQPFYRETTGQYYLLITGLNFNVPKDTVKVVYLKATAVSTYPSSVTGLIQLTVPLGGVRAVTSGGAVNLFEPQQNPVSNRFLPQGTLATSAQLSVVRTSDTPQERNVIANELVTGTGTGATMRLTQDLPLLKVRLTAQNDTLRLREVVATFTVSNSALQPTQFYFQIDGRKVGTVNVVQSGTTGTTTISDIFPENVTVPAGSSKEAVLGVSWVDGITYADRTLTVTLTDVIAENSLGSTAASFTGGSVTSEPVHLFAVAPTFGFRDAQVTASRDQNLSTTTLSFTGKIVVSVPSNVHAGGQVRISSSSPFALQWEFSNTSTPATTTYSIASVRDANGNLVNLTGGYYVLNAGDTYYFELTAQTVVSGAPQGRVRVNSITWEPGNNNVFTGSPVTSTYVSRDFAGWSN